MNARELHDWMRNIADTEPDADVLAVTRGFYETILRALDLLARVEESEDELVRRLRAKAIQTASTGHPPWDGYELAAAAIVALKAERDALKAHAEAMANALEHFPNNYEALHVYRRDFPRTP